MRWLTHPPRWPMADPARLDALAYTELERVEKQCRRCGTVFEGYRFTHMPHNSVELSDGKVVDVGMCTPCSVTWDT